MVSDPCSCLARLHYLSSCVFCRHTVGDSTVPFCLQSCVKPLKYAVAVHDHGSDYVHSFIGKEPSGLRFNKLFLNEEGEPVLSAPYLCLWSIPPFHTSHRTLKTLLALFPHELKHPGWGRLALNVFDNVRTLCGSASCKQSLRTEVNDEGCQTQVVGEVFRSPAV